MSATIRLVILTALRDRLFAGLFLLLGVTIALSVFLGGTALLEQLQAAQAFAAGGGRAILVLGLTIFAAFHIQTLFETREVEAILARSISRVQFVLAYWLGLTVVALIVSGLFASLVVLSANGTAGAYLWAATLMAECVIVVAVATLAGLMLERATPTVLFVLGLYVLARLMGFFIGIRNVTEQSAVNQVVTRALDFVTLFIPRLDMFAQSQWIAHGSAGVDVMFFVVQTGLFIAVALAAAIFDLSRKQF